MPHPTARINSLPCPLPPATQIMAKYIMESTLCMGSQPNGQPDRANPAARIEGGVLRRAKNAAPLPPRRNAIVALDENGAPISMTEPTCDHNRFPIARQGFKTLLADHGPDDAARIRFVEHLETGGDAGGAAAAISWRIRMIS